MKDVGMRRLQRALAAIKQAEMAELGSQVRLAASNRAEAQRLRAQSRGLAARHEDAAGLLQLSQWQHALERKARAAGAAADAADAAAVPLRAALARTLGRESVASALIRSSDREFQQRIERRAEDIASAKPAKPPDP